MRHVALERAHFLFARTDHMGDMLLATPAFDAIKQAFPAARLTVLASSANADIARMHPAVDRVEVESTGTRGLRRLRGLTRFFRQLDVDVVLFGYEKHHLAQAALLARIPIRIGTTHREYSFFLYTHRIRASRRPPYEHDATVNLRLLEPLGLSPTPPPPARVQIVAADRASVSKLLDELDVPPAAPLAVVHATNSGLALNASPQWYVTLCDQLDASGYRIVLTGTIDDRASAGALSAAVRRPPVDLTGRLSIGQLAALLARAVLFVGSSTGPTHLAATIGTPTVALYSPVLKQARWYPRGAHVATLIPEVGITCPVCIGSQCPYWVCMERIPIERVVASGRDLATTRGQAPSSTATSPASAAGH